MENRPKTGRPSLYTPELAQEILHRVKEGEPLTSICRDPHMPNISTIFRWADDDVEAVPPSFRTDLERARKTRARVWAEESVEIADNGRNDWEERESARGNPFIALNSEAVRRSELRIELRKWFIDRELGNVQQFQKAQQPAPVVNVVLSKSTDN